MEQCKQNLRGSWTKEKLATVKNYLQAYTKIMSSQNFKYAYIDAFAGTGYLYQGQEFDSEQQSFLTKDFGDEEKEFLDGSARIALCIDPPFHRYIFVEKDPVRCEELENFKKEFESLSDRIIIENKDANSYLLELCKRNWKKHRAVVFLDPYGMQVKWDTVEAIARTQAIDLWILFPLGQAVNRLLKKDGKINDSNRNKLSELFGDEGWFDLFYQESEQLTFINTDEKVYQKVADFGKIKSYFINRLDTVFSEVENNARLLHNSKGNPLYMLCFAAGNPRGAPTALKIADYILGKKL